LCGVCKVDPTSPYYYGYNGYHLPTNFEYVGLLADLGHGWKLDLKPYTYSYKNHLWYTTPPIKTPTGGVNPTFEELTKLHRIEQARTTEQVTKAKEDDEEEDMFVFKTVFGTGFTPEALPVTAALGAHVKNEQSVLGNQLKRYYQRPRPYQIDTTLHPVCALKTEHDSYPSGHSLTGYLEAFTLASIVPERRNEILARADDYAHNRLVCGVHYPSDIEASRRVAYAVFGYMLATPRFQRDLAAAREEMRTKLGLEGKKN